MLHIKIFLAILLSAIPFVLTYYFNGKTSNKSKRANVFTFIRSHLPLISNLITALEELARRIYMGMKKSDNFRKFFVLITFLFMLVIQFFDYCATTSVLNMIRGGSGDTSTDVNILRYVHLISSPYATLTAACISLSFFSYKATDWLLTLLHRSNRLFFIVALFTLIVLFYKTSLFIVAETVSTVLIAAWIYPDKIATEGPKGKMSIPSLHQQEEYLKAA